MNAKQAMRKAKKLAELEAARKAMEEKEKLDQMEETEKERRYPLWSLLDKLNELTWNGDEDKISACLIEHWPGVREELRRHVSAQGGKKLDFSNVPIDLPEAEKARETDLQTDFFNIMNEMDMYLLNAKKYREMVLFYQDMLELFDLSGGKYKLERDNFRSAIGEAYDRLGEKEKRDQYFTEILEQEPERNDYLAAHYAMLLLEEKDLEKAEAFMADYKDTTDDLMLDRFQWLKELQKETCS